VPNRRFLIELRGRRGLFLGFSSHVWKGWCNVKLDVNTSYFIAASFTAGRGNGRHNVSSNGASATNCKKKQPYIDARRLSLITFRVPCTSAREDTSFSSGGAEMFGKQCLQIRKMWKTNTHAISE